MTLEQRVAKLERQNRWLRRGGAIAVAIAATVFLVSQAAAGKETPGRPATVEAQAFSLVNKGGDQLFCVGIGKCGLPFLQMADNSGRTRVLIAFDTSETPTIRLIDERANDRVRIGFLEDDVPYIGLAHEDETTRVWASITKEGTPELSLYEGGRSAVWEALPKKEAPK